MLSLAAKHALTGALIFQLSLAAPTPVELEAITKVAVRQAATGSPISNTDELSSALSSFTSAFDSVSSAIDIGEEILSEIVPAASPTSIADVQSQLQSINDDFPGDIFATGFEILFNGLAGGDFSQIINAWSTFDNQNNDNTVEPATAVYPQLGPDDAPYSVSEQQLRQVIYIPPSFTYGQLQPVIFIPGTSSAAGSSFGSNYGNLLSANGIADPVYVNIPDANLGDIQVNSEYIAYAVNYISGISGGVNVSTISWSAGSLDGQWALKYWPSTRSVMSNKISVSPDYYGTVEAILLCPGFETPGCTPAIAQQNYNSTFIQTLRNNGGDSAYVPTTDLYSIFDEVVEPQTDPNASGFLGDANGVAVTNVEVQSVCSAALPGGTFYNTHEGMLYNALGYLLAVDALTNGGPAQLSRINATAACGMDAAPGLTLADVLATEALVPVGAYNALVYEPKSSSEPAIMPYAAGDTPS